MQLVDNINKTPELVTSLGSLVAKSGFDWSFMEAIIRGLKEEWLMDKAIQVMVDTWNEYANKKDKRCYENGGSYTSYNVDEHGVYSVERPLYKMLKYPFLEHDLKCVKSDELERRKVNEKFNKMLAPSGEQEEEPQFTYTDNTFKKSAMLTDMQIDLMLAKLIVSGWMGKDSSQSDYRKLFSGNPGKFYLTWTGADGELHDLFDMLTRKRIERGKKVPEYITPRGGYLNIVCSHFKDKKGKWFKDLNRKRHTDGTKDVLNMLDIVLNYSLDECIRMMGKIAEEHKALLENIDLSVKPEHYSNYGKKIKGTK